MTPPNTSLAHATPAWEDTLTGRFLGALLALEGQARDQLLQRGSAVRASKVLRQVQDLKHGGPAQLERGRVGVAALHLRAVSDDFDQSPDLGGQRPLSQVRDARERPSQAACSFQRGSRDSRNGLA